MKERELKDINLSIIEDGRMDNSKMKNIIGGSETCELHTTCPGFKGKSYCEIYSKCGWFSKNTCDFYNYLVEPITPQ